VRVRITKAQAIEAIRTEPSLQAGVWASPKTGTSPYYIGLDQLRASDTEQCHVCAVGAVLRQLLDETNSAGTIGVVAGRNTSGGDVRPEATRLVAFVAQARRHLKGGRVWNALSIIFEGYSNLKSRAATAREDTIAFVEAEFPDDWELDSQDASLREGVAKEVTP
jgi:hypothetical protein